jgi:hypothetical protein
VTVDASFCGVLQEPARPKEAILGLHGGCSMKYRERCTLPEVLHFPTEPKFVYTHRLIFAWVFDQKSL